MYLLFVNTAIYFCHRVCFSYKKPFDKAELLPLFHDMLAGVAHLHKWYDYLQEHASCCC